jgi:hypothetical protein
MGHLREGQCSSTTAMGERDKRSCKSRVKKEGL